jgi:hypothetical protein
VALGSAVGMAALLLWSSGLLVHYPSGWEVLATPPELATMGVFSALFGLLVPLQIAALTKARSAAGALGAPRYWPTRVTNPVVPARREPARPGAVRAAVGWMSHSHARIR